MNNKRAIVRAISEILKQLTKKTFKVTGRGQIEEYNVHVYYSMPYKELRDLVKVKDVDFDHILTLMKENKDIEFENQNAFIKITPCGVNSYIFDKYKDASYKLAKTKADYILRSLPLITVCVAILSFVVKEFVLTPLHKETQTIPTPKEIGLTNTTPQKENKLKNVENKTKTVLIHHKSYTIN